jgi:hypothetical protein
MAISGTPVKQKKDFKVSWFHGFVTPSGRTAFAPFIETLRP